MKDPKEKEEYERMRRQVHAFAARMRERNRERKLWMKDPIGRMMEVYGSHAREIIRKAESGEASRDALSQEAAARRFLLEMDDHLRWKAKGAESVALYYALKMAAVGESFSIEGFYNRLGRSGYQGRKTGAAEAAAKRQLGCVERNDRIREAAAALLESGEERRRIAGKLARRVWQASEYKPAKRLSERQIRRILNPPKKK